MKYLAIAVIILTCLTSCSTVNSSKISCPTKFQYSPEKQKEIANELVDPETIKNQRPKCKSSLQNTCDIINDYRIVRKQIEVCKR